MNAPFHHIPAAAPAYDLERVRADFPALALRVHGHPLTYLDSAASAQKPVQVLDRMRRAYESEYANVHRGLHHLADAATEAFEGAREAVRGFINAPSADEVVFTKNATEAINLVAASFGGARVGEGDEIVLSILEHHANIVPWHFLRERRGAVLRWAPVDEAGNFLIEEFAALLNERTKMVAITMMSNALGTITPIREIVALARERGIPVLVDASQAVVHLDVDVQAIGCDFLVFTGHKLYGPSGIGVLWGRRELLAAMAPYQGGGEMILDVSEEGVTCGAPPTRFEAGTPPIVEAIGLGAAIAYVEGVGKGAIRAHEDALVAYAHERLGAMNAVRLVGTARAKGAIVSFTLDGAHPHDVATVLDRRGVAVRAGAHCAGPLLKRYGLTATCRASFGMYSTREEVDRLAEALGRAHVLFA